MFNGFKTCWVRGYHVYPERGSKCKICDMTEEENMIFGYRPSLAPAAKLIVESNDNELSLGCPFLMLVTFPDAQIPDNIRRFTDLINLLAKNNCDPPTPDDLYDMIFDNSMNGNAMTEVEVQHSRKLRKRLAKKYGDNRGA
jgi:hypothetical protein